MDITLNHIQIFYYKELKVSIGQLIKVQFATGTL